MTTFTRVAIVAMTMVGVANAQPAKAPPAKTDAKADMKAAEPPAMPKPPAEVDAMGKTVTGTWTCKGDEWDQKGAKSPITATNKVKVDLDKWWIVENLEVKGRMAFRLTSYSTYDATSKKWRRVGIDNMGGQMVGTSDGMKDMKMTWNLDMLGPMGAGMFRDHMDMTDTKVGVKFSGQMSMDKGKSWNKVYEMACKK